MDQCTSRAITSLCGEGSAINEEPSTASPRIVVHQLEHNYQNSVLALQGISFHVNDGDTVAILGANGSGKTTLLLHLVGVLLPSKGEVIVDGLITKKQDLLSIIRSKVGIVFQDPNEQLFMPTVIEDVAFGLLNREETPDNAQAKASAILEHFGLMHLSNRNPAFLSLGEKKLVAIAGVLAMQPDILLFDEPTASLDPPSSRKIADVIRELQAKGHTIIFTTHNVNLAAHLATRIILLHQGCLVADGQPQNILTDDSLLKKLHLAPPTAVKIARSLGLPTPYPILIKDLFPQLTSKRRETKD